MFTRFKWPESVVFFLTPQMAQIRFFYDACQTLFNKTISLAPPPRQIQQPGSPSNTLITEWYCDQIKQGSN